MDERVEIAATALYGSMFHDPPDGFPNEDVASVQRHRASDVIAALEAAGYTVARLEKSKQYELSDDGRSSEPLYRIVKEGDA